VSDEPLASVHHLPVEPLVDEDAYLRGQRDTLWTMVALLNSAEDADISPEGQLLALRDWALCLNPEAQ